MSSEDEEENEAEEDQSEASGKKSVKGASKKYVPPRLVPVHYGRSCGRPSLVGVLFLFSFACSRITRMGFYHADETEAEREQKRLEKAKRRALSSSVIRELKEQYSDAPEEIRDARHPHVTRQSQEDQHRSEFLHLEILSNL